MKQTFDCVLVERKAGDGLYPEDILDMTAYLSPDKEHILTEVDSLYGDSSAIGFLTVEAEEQMPDKDLFDEIIGRILSDLDLQADDGIHQIEGLRVFLAQDTPSKYLTVAEDEEVAE